MKTPLWIKLLTLTGLASAIIGLIVLYKIPGNIALIPLTIGGILSITAFIAAQLKKSKCYLVYLVFALSLGGTIYLLTGKQTSEVVVDEIQEQQLEKASKTIEDSEELDDLLDEL